MTNLYILMWVYLTYMGLSFWLFGYNVLSPSFVFSGSLSAMLCVAYWAANNMQGMYFAINIRTFTVFAWAGFVFLATELMVYALHTADCPRNISLSDTRKPEPLFIHPQIQNAALVFLAVSLIAATFVLYVNTSGGSFSTRMSEYKTMVLSITRSADLRYRFIVSQMQKINLVIADIVSYVMIYNVSLCGVPLKTQARLAACLCLYGVFTMVYSGARQMMIETGLFLITIYITINMKPGGKKKIFLSVLKALPFLLLAASSFTFLGLLLGRAEAGKSGLQNVVEYLCGGLYAFNARIDLGGASAFFGQWTFSFVYLIPQNLGLMTLKDDIVIFGDFDIYGNTVTIFGRWYRDFGAVGVYIMTFFVSLIYSRAFYKKIIYSANILKERHLSRIYYSQFITGLIWAGYDDRISPLLTMQTLVFIILTAVAYKIIIEDRFRLV